MIIGQEVCILSSRRSFNRSRAEFGFVITAISPTGQITVTHPTRGEKIRFTKHGREIGASRFYGRLMDEDVQTRRRLHERENIVDEIVSITGRRYINSGEYRNHVATLRDGLIRAEQLINRLEEIENDK